MNMIFLEGIMCHNMEECEAFDYEQPINHLQPMRHDVGESPLLKICPIPFIRFRAHSLL